MEMERIASQETGFLCVLIATTTASEIPLASNSKCVPQEKKEKETKKKEKKMKKKKKKKRGFAGLFFADTKNHATGCMGFIWLAHCCCTLHSRACSARKKKKKGQKLIQAKKTIEGSYHLSSQHRPPQSHCSPCIPLHHT